MNKEGYIQETADGNEPTEEELRTLKHVAESLPISAWLVAVVELCERFSYYGMQGLFQNYIQRPLDGSLGRGALGMSLWKPNKNIQSKLIAVDRHGSPSSYRFGHLLPILVLW